MRNVVPELPQSSTALGSRSPANPRTAHRRRAVRVGLHPDAELLEHGGRVADVGPIGETRDPAATLGDRREQQRPMRDPLATGQPQPAPQRAPTFEDELLGHAHVMPLRDTW